MILSGSDIIVEVLKQQGVDTVFGYPGGTAISVFDALYRRGEGIRNVLTSHEQGAAHAADGYARATGRTGVCLVTSGPGATNLVTGIATAYMDSVPMVAITVNVSTASLGKDSFQEVDIAGVTMPVTKHNFIVKSIESLAGTLERAFTIARSGRPGPVLVDIPKDITRSETDYEPKALNVNASQNHDGAGSGETAKEQEIAELVRRIRGAKRPLIVAGGGSGRRDGGSAVRRLAQLAHIPVADTLMGKGIIPGTSPLYLGMMGLYGTAAAHYATSNADLIIAAGMRFSERVTHNKERFASQAFIVQIDIDRAELDKNVPVDLAIAGDAATVLRAVADRLETMETRPVRHKAWLERLDALKKTAPAGDVGDRLTGADTVRCIYEATKGEAVIVTEVGLNQMWAATEYRFSYPGQLLTSGGLGTMGYGLGAAIGASFGCPKSTIINIAGDGCFRMNMNELLTAVRYRLPIIEVILDNSSLGMVHQLQGMFYDGRYSQTEFEDGADYAAIAEAMGAGSRTCETRGELVEALQHALTVRDGRPQVIVCRIGRGETFDFE